MPASTRALFSLSNHTGTAYPSNSSAERQAADDQTGPSARRGVQSDGHRVSDRSYTVVCGPGRARVNIIEVSHVRRIFQIAEIRESMARFRRPDRRRRERDCACQDKRGPLETHVHIFPARPYSILLYAFECTASQPRYGSASHTCCGFLSTMISSGHEHRHFQLHYRIGNSCLYNAISLHHDTYATEAYS